MTLTSILCHGSRLTVFWRQNSIIASRLPYQTGQRAGRGGSGSTDVAASIAGAIRDGCQNTLYATSAAAVTSSIECRQSRQSRVPEKKT